MHKKSLLSMPPELLLLIFSYLNSKELSTSAAVSKQFKLMAYDEQLWLALLQSCNYLSEKKQKKSSISFRNLFKVCNPNRIIMDSEFIFNRLPTDRNQINCNIAIITMRDASRYKDFFVFLLNSSEVMISRYATVPLSLDHIKFEFATYGAEMLDIPLVCSTMPFKQMFVDPDLVLLFCDLKNTESLNVKLQALSEQGLDLRKVVLCYPPNKHASEALISLNEHYKVASLMIPYEVKFKSGINSILIKSIFANLQRDYLKFRNQSKKENKAQNNTCNNKRCVIS